MQNQKLMIMFAGICGLLTAGTTLAQGWYLGAEAGYVEHTFKVHYAYTFNETQDDYKDPAYGVMGSLVGGYRFPVMEKVSLALQGRVTTDNAEWTLTTDEPAELTYGMPWAYSASLLPEVKLLEKLSLFGELGIGQGYFHQKKTSPVSSRYDAKEWAPAYSFGGGVRYTLCKQWQAFIQYRYTTYGKISYDSYLPDGTHWEMIECDADTHHYNAGLCYAF